MLLQIRGEDGGRIAPAPACRPVGRDGLEIHPRLPDDAAGLLEDPSSAYRTLASLDTDLVGQPVAADRTAAGLQTVNPGRSLGVRSDDEELDSLLRRTFTQWSGSLALP